MNYFQAENLSKAYAEKILFENITFGIEQGQKTGLIARNGAGKTTLINIMMQKDIPDNGNCNFRKDIRVACLDQNPGFDPKPSVLDTILSDNSPLISTLRDYELELKLHEQHPDKADSVKLQHLTARMDELNAWNLEARIKQILTQLKITGFDQPIGELSGGQVKRVALAKILIEEADFIILDEPTNHLDIEMIEWLQDYLARQKLTLLLVTHDRYFLDAVCTDILELEGGNLYSYKGNYAYFLEKKQERETAMHSITEKARNLLRKEAEWMRRQPQARTTKSKSRIDAYYKLKDTAAGGPAAPKTEILMQATRMGKKILELENISKRFDDKQVINQFSYIFKKKEKVGIVGMNGTGKTTLLNLITQRLQPDSGTISTGETIQFGYFTQDDLNVDSNKRVIEVIKDIAETIQVGKGVSLTAAQFLFHFNFPYYAQNDFVSKLSGGEKRRLHLLTVLMKNPNFLILDEPTNDLDIHTLNVLEDFLENFPGCLMVVSHDRYFLDNLADHIFVFEGDGKIKDFPGNYSDYRLKHSEIKLSARTDEKGPLSKPAKKAEKVKKKLSYKEQKEFELLESEISALENLKTEILQQMNSGALPPAEMVRISDEYARVEKTLEEKENRWLELSEWV